MSEPGPRQSLLLPLVIPLASLAAIGLVLFGFSRILLNTTHAAATVVAVVAAVGILGIAAFVAARSRGGSVALLSMVGGAAGIALLAGGVALVAAPPHEGEGDGGAPVVAIAAPPNAAVDGFAQDRVTVPADVAFEIGFDNQDPGVGHNVEVAVEEGGETLFEGEIVTGPVATTYSIEEPLAEGEYFFFCVVHPTTMTGTLEAVPGGVGEGGGEGEGEDGGEGGGAGGVTVVAQELAFDPTEISLPADTPSTIAFDNRDDVGTFGPHNIAIYEDEAYTSALFTGELVNGPAVVDYAVPAIPAGAYFFRCDVHPQMTGTVAVDGGG